LGARKIGWRTVALPPWCSTKGRRRLSNVVATYRTFSAVRAAIGTFEPDLLVSNSIFIRIAARATNNLGFPYL
jgi:hypothetical protein